MDGSIIPTTHQMFDKFLFCCCSESRFCFMHDAELCDRQKWPNYLDSHHIEARSMQH